MILVTGATGRVGRYVIAALRERGVPCRALVRDRAKAASLGDDIELVVADLDESDTLAPAFESIDRLFLVTPAGPEQPSREIRIIDAACAAGVRHVVKLSVLGAAEDAPFVFGRSHWQVERHLRASGVDWSVLRPNRFFENFLSPGAISSQGHFYGCQGNGAVSMIGVTDIAAVAASVLDGEGHAGEVSVLTGPEALTPDQQAMTLSERIGREVKYVDLAPDELQRKMGDTGTPQWFATALTDLYIFYRNGGAREVTSDVHSLIAQRPQNLTQWCHEHDKELRESTTIKLRG